LASSRTGSCAERKATVKFSLRADPLVEDGDRLAAGDRLLIPPGPAVRDVETVQRGATQGEDVEGLVAEDVAGVLVALELPGDTAAGPVRHATAVGVEQATQEWPGVLVDDALLPFLERDRPRVLGAGPVLRKEAGPMDRVALDVSAAGALPQ
jgi:hypothetical protein